MDYSLKEQVLDTAYEKISRKGRLLFIPCIENDYRPGFLQSRALFYSVLVILVFKILIIAVSFNLPANIFFADITKNTLVNFVNQGREQAGLSSLRVNERLNQAAYLKAEDMLKNGYFYHVSPTGVTPWYWFSEAGYNYKYAGENLAIGFVDSKEVYSAWYNSISHRDNILNPNYTEIGTAVLGGFGKNGAIVVVQLFGSQKPEPIQVAPKKQTEVKEPSAIVENKQPTSNQLVLSESVESADETGLIAKYIGLISYNYEEFLQKIILGLTSLISMALLLNIFINLNIQRKDLILRALIFIVLLFSTALINKELVAQIIPHTLTIYG